MAQVKRKWIKCKKQMKNGKCSLAKITKKLCYYFIMFQFFMSTVCAFSVTLFFLVASLHLSGLLARAVTNSVLHFCFWWNVLHKNAYFGQIVT